MLPCCADHPFDECDLLEDIRNKPWEVLLNDIMFYLCENCKVLWVPPCYRKYQIHPQSPFNINICCYIGAWFKEFYAESEIMRYYSNKEKSMTTNEMFENQTSDLKEKLSCLSQYLIEKNTYKLLQEILKISIYCIMIYENGMQDAICYGVTNMTEVFTDYLARVPDDSFDDILKSMSSQHRRFSRVRSVASSSMSVFYDLSDTFVSDILFFLCQKFEIVWFPSEYNEYKINLSSPLSSNICDFLQKFCYNAEESNKKVQIYYKNDECVFQAFSKRLPEIMECISASTIPEVRSVEEVFLLVIRTALMAIQLHIRRVYRILSTTRQQLSVALCKCDRRNKGRIFCLFDVLARLRLNKKITFEVNHLDSLYFNEEYFAL